jgi:hypothetical protein
MRAWHRTAAWVSLVLSNLTTVSLARAGLMRSHTTAVHGAQRAAHTSRGGTLRAPAAPKETRDAITHHASSRRRRGSALRAMAADGESNAALEGMDDLNVLQTALRAAVQREDYAAAAALRDRIDTLSPDGYTREDWRDLGLPEWLANRAERCGYSFPTSVQVSTPRRFRKQWL